MQGGADLRAVRADLHGPGPARLGGGPRDGPVQRVVDLEDAGAVAVAGVVVAEAGDAGQGGGRGVEDVRPGRRQVVEALDLVVGVHGAAEFAQVGGEGVGDRLGAAAGDGPAAGVRGEGEDEAYGGGGEAAERRHHVGDEPGEEGAGALVVEAAGQPGRRRQSDEAEPGEGDGVAGQRGQRQRHEVADQGVPAVQEGRDEPPVRAGVARPEGGGRLADRAGQHGRGAVQERVGHGQLGVQPLQAVPLQRQSAEGGRADGEGVGGGAGVVPEAGRVSSSVRAPPPTVPLASKRATEKPRRASSTAAVSPFGPAPTTTASSIDGTFGLLRQPTATGIRICRGAGVLRSRVASGA